MTDYFRIRLKGHLDPRYNDWLADFSMTYRPGGETILTGPVPDQSALFGLLLRIRDLRIPLLSLEPVVYRT